MPETKSKNWERAMTKKLSKKDVGRLLLSIFGTLLLGLTVYWAGMYLSKYVALALYICVPVVLCLFLIGILKNKLSLFKIATLVTYFGIIILVAVALVLKSGILDEIINAEDAMALSNILEEKYGKWVGVAIIVIEFLQVTFVPIPSSIVTGAAYYICGQNPWLAILYSCVGLWIGSLFAFFLGRTFGVRLVKWVAGEKILLKYNDLVKGKDKIMLIYMFILPVFPDDVLCMIAGLTTMSYLGFTTVQIISRPLNVAATVFLLHFSTGLTQLIPLNTVWGIAVWAVIIAAFVALFIITWKKADKIEALMYKLITKITGRPVLVDINKLYKIKIEKEEEQRREKMPPVVDEVVEEAVEEEVIPEPVEEETTETVEPEPKETPEEREIRLMQELARETNLAYKRASELIESTDKDINF